MVWVIDTTSGCARCSSPHPQASRVDQFRGEFAIRGGDGEELDAANPFRGAVFVGIDMRCCCADDSAPAREQGLQGKDVGPCSIEDRICGSSCPEVGLDDLLKRCCVDIFAVCCDVAFVGCLNCFDDFGVSPGVVIRGEAPVCRVVQAPRQYLRDACFGINADAHAGAPTRWPAVRGKRCPLICSASRSKIRCTASARTLTSV